MITKYGEFFSNALHLNNYILASKYAFLTALEMEKTTFIQECIENTHRILDRMSRRILSSQ